METKSEPYIRDVWYWFELNRMRLKVSWVGPSVLRIKAECSELGIDDMVGHLDHYSGEWRWRDGFAEFASRFSDRNCHAITEYLETHPVPEEEQE